LNSSKKLTFSQIRYMIALYRLSGDGVGVKNAELAASLAFSKASVHNMLRTLCDMGLVTQKSFGLAHLTDAGRLLAEKYTACYTRLEDALAAVCGKDSVSEGSLCAVLADIPEEALDTLAGE